MAHPGSLLASFDSTLITLYSSPVKFFNIWSDSSLFFISNLSKVFPSFCKDKLQKFVLVLFCI